MHVAVIVLACIGGLVVAWTVLAGALLTWMAYTDRRAVHRQAESDREFRRLIAQLTDTIPYDQETD
jgi:hypothetical protein